MTEVAGQLSVAYARLGRVIAEAERMLGARHYAVWAQVPLGIPDRQLVLYFERGSLMVMEQDTPRLDRLTECSLQWRTAALERLPELFAALETANHSAVVQIERACADAETWLASLKDDSACAGPSLVP